MPEMQDGLLRQTEKEKRLANKRHWNKNNRAKNLAWQRDWRQRNSDKVHAQHKRENPLYYQRHKEKELQRTQKWNKENVERRQELHKDWREKNRVYDKEYKGEYYRRNQKEIRRKHIERNTEARIAALETYGGPICKCCGETEMGFLTIDHTNNNGATHRKKIGRVNIYLWLKNNNYPSGFQVLCMQCNFVKGKRNRNGICPHQEMKTPIDLFLEKYPNKN